MIKLASIVSLFFLAMPFCNAQKEKDKNNIAVIAYYAGRNNMIDSFEVEKLTHLIFSFCHLKGNSLSVDNARDSATIMNMVALKKRNPQLKIMLSLGGWGGCKTCSDVFSTNKGRKEFSKSAKNSVIILEQTELILIGNILPFQVFPAMHTDRKINHISRH